MGYVVPSLGYSSNPPSQRSWSRAVIAAQPETHCSSKEEECGMAMCPG